MANWCIITLTSTDRVIDFLHSEGSPLSFDRVIPMPLELNIMRRSHDVGRLTFEDSNDFTYIDEDDDYILGVRNKHMFGYTDWYDWRVNNWGCKWDASDVDLDDGVLSFTTPWCPPYEFLEYVSSRFPEDVIEISWVEEFDGHLKELEILNGNFTKTFDGPMEELNL